MEHLRSWILPSSRTDPGLTGLAFHVDPSRTDLRDEGYELVITPQAVRGVSRTSGGLVFAAQTFRQLASAHGDEVPCCRITDRPRFPWRGVHLDSARRFFPVETVIRLIDLASLHKLNRFHWHLTDDQGWRLEVPSRTRLTDIGSSKNQFYAQSDIRRVVSHAQALGITVVPEIDLPGHMQAAIAAYPELGCAKSRVGVRRTWGISRHVLNPLPSTMAFLEEVFREVLQLFPGTWIHVGGDEVRTGQWKRNAAVRERVRELGLTSEQELQGWFTAFIASWLSERGRRMIGWDEVLESTSGRLPEGAVVMAWRNARHGAAAARAGLSVVMTPTSHTYFDYRQDLGPQGYGTLTTLRKVYGYEPVPAALDRNAAARILGTQGQLWSERIPHQDALDRQAFPRLCALSEVAWSPREARDWQSFKTRLGAHLRLLQSLGVRYHRREGKRLSP
ncbi:MAG TPA: beta-N-acetylhexosaminidase [Spirochaetia bacterium]|nr:beta-N-acetylhexosaminidase [Spirochaetia bacterium]